MVFVPTFDGTPIGRPLSAQSLHTTQGMTAAHDTGRFGEQAVVHQSGGGSRLRQTVDPDSDEGRMQKNGSIPDLDTPDHLVFTRLPDRGKVALYPGQQQRIDYMGKRDVTRRRVRSLPAAAAALPSLLRLPLLLFSHSAWLLYHRARRAPV